MLKWRPVMLGLCLMAAALSGASLYFQWVMFLNPCPLCLAQRFAMFGLTGLFFVAIFVTKKIGMNILLSLQLLFAAFGAAMAGRHVWLLHYPEPESSGCIPDLSILWGYLPFQDFVKIFFNGSGSCLDNPWHFLSFSMPAWSLLCFVGFLLAIGLSYYARK